MKREESSEQGQGRDENWEEMEALQGSGRRPVVTGDEQAGERREVRVFYPCSLLAQGIFSGISCIPSLALSFPW